MVTVFAVACRHTRDLVDHEPGICYVGQGWNALTTDNAQWDVDGVPIHGRAYQFAWPYDTAQRQTKVFSILVTPRGETTGRMSDLAEAAADYRLDRFGAAAVQLSTEESMTEEQWHQTSHQFMDSIVPLIQQFRDSCPVERRARPLETALVWTRNDKRLSEPPPGPIVQ